MADRHSFFDFGPYRIDPRERALLCKGRPVPLAPKAFQTLLVLVRNSGHVVEKEHLMQEVCPDTFVEEANLTQNILRLRKVLGESADGSKYIETVPRRGYRFVASVNEVFEPTPLPTSSRRNPRVTCSTHFVAVLPFIAVSAHEQTEYLAESVTEGLIRNLSQLPQLRVMSHIAVLQYKGSEHDAMQIARTYGVDAVVVGKISEFDDRLLLSAELVDVATGCQLWGNSYSHQYKDIFEAQVEITKQISSALRVRLTEEQPQLTKRYTDNAEAYQSYLRGRAHWSNHTREGLMKAIRCFRQAIDFDPNYALAYAGIVDCYLRLATNYLPPPDSPDEATLAPQLQQINERPQHQARRNQLEIRCEWDRKAAEREIRRAAELKSNYPAAHQWHAAYLLARELFETADVEANGESRPDTVGPDEPKRDHDTGTAFQIQSLTLLPAEEVQVLCVIAREQIDSGNYDAACAVLKRWWTLGEWPELEGLSPHSSADLLFTVGALAGWVTSTRQVPRGQKHAEALLNGAIGLCEQLNLKTLAAEGRIELAYCYHREGLSELARSTLGAAFDVLSDADRELKGLCLVRLGIVERRAGRLQDSLVRLKDARTIAGSALCCTARYDGELGTTLKEIAIAEKRSEFFELALERYRKALFEFKSVGIHRHTATTENNQGYLLLALGRLDEAEPHLMGARRLFASLDDNAKRAQVDETLAQLHLAAEQFDLAEQAARRAVETLEAGGEEALLTESLTTRGRILLRIGRQREAKRVLNRAVEVAERCGDGDGAGRALLVLIEELASFLEKDECVELGARVERLLGGLQQTSTGERLRQWLDILR